MTREYVEKQLQYAKEQYKLENYGRAEKAVNQILDSKLVEYRGEALFLKGSILYDNGYYEESIAFLTECIDNHPNLTDALFFRVQSYNHVGKFKEARLDAEKLIENTPNDVNCIESLLTVARLTEDNALVIECCSRMLAIDSLAYEYIVERADGYFSIGQYQKAIADYNKAFLVLKREERENPDFYDYGYELGILISLGESYIKLEDYYRAEDYLKKAMDLSEDDDITNCLMGYLLHKKGNSEEGMYFLLKAKSISPYNCSILLYLARTYIDLDDGYRAYECITKVNELDEADDHKEEIEELMSYLEFE